MKMKSRALKAPIIITISGYQCVTLNESRIPVSPTSDQVRAKKSGPVLGPQIVEKAINFPPSRLKCSPRRGIP